MEIIILKKVWDKFLVTQANVQAPLTKITKKIRNEIINTRTKPNESINNQLKLFLFVYVNKYSYLLRCI